jgi:hypothetical protein|tara:strand:- start:6142 stop:6741 length:600 start_codon:yes stop_codon:yes gene_type:complete
MKTLFTIHGGEWLVGEEVERRYKGNDVTVWVPGSKDRGIDLLITNNTNGKSVGIQVKFSKSYEKTSDPLEEFERSRGWWKFSARSTSAADKISQSPADVWVLVWYNFKEKECDFLIVEPGVLAERFKALGRSSNVIYSYMSVLSIAGNKYCIETRSMSKAQKKQLLEAPEKCCSEREWTSFLSAWDQIDRLLGICEPVT